MEDTDFNEKAFDMIGPNAPQDVKMHGWKLLRKLMQTAWE